MEGNISTNPRDRWVAVVAVLGAATLFAIFIIPMLYVTFQTMREATHRRFGNAPAGRVQHHAGED